MVIDMAKAHPTIPAERHRSTAAPSDGVGPNDIPDGFYPSAVWRAIMQTTHTAAGVTNE
jgi:hypothetical protein